MLLRWHIKLVPLIMNINKLIAIIAFNSSLTSYAVCPAITGKWLGSCDDGSTTSHDFDAQNCPTIVFDHEKYILNGVATNTISVAGSGWGVVYGVVVDPSSSKIIFDKTESSIVPRNGVYNLETRSFRNTLLKDNESLKIETVSYVLNNSGGFESKVNCRLKRE